MSNRWSYAITTKGLELLADLNEKTLKFTTVKCSKATTTSDLSELEELTDEVCDIEIVESKGSGSALNLRARLSNASITETFNLYQLGLYAKSYTGNNDPDETDIGVLVQVWQTSLPDVVPSSTESPGVTKDYMLTTQVSNASSVTVNLNQAVYATQDDIDTHNESGTAHADIRATLNILGSEFNKYALSASQTFESGVTATLNIPSATIEETGTYFMEASLFSNFTAEGFRDFIICVDDVIVSRERTDCVTGRKTQKTCCYLPLEEGDVVTAKFLQETGSFQTILEDPSINYFTLRRVY